MLTAQNKNNNVLGHGNDTQKKRGGKMCCNC